MSNKLFLTVLGRILTCALAWHSALIFTIIVSLALIVLQVQILPGLSRKPVRVYLLALFLIGQTLAALLIMVDVPSFWVGFRSIGLIIYGILITFWDGLLFNGNVDGKVFAWMYSVYACK
jgi:hypothetical protein